MQLLKCFSFKTNMPIGWERVAISRETINREKMEKYSRCSKVSEKTRRYEIYLLGVIIKFWQRGFFFFWRGMEKIGRIYREDF